MRRNPAGPTDLEVHPSRSVLDGWHAAAERFVGDDDGRSIVISGDGIRVAIGDEIERPGASLLKLHLAAAVHVLASRHELDLAATATLADLPSSIWPSFLDALHPDHRFTLAELAGLSLATGDNRVAGHLLSIVGHDRVGAIARDLGCEGTNLAVGFGDEVLNARGRANITTAADCERILTHLATDPTLAALRPALRTTLFTGRIHLRLPGEVVVSHKTGTLRGVVNDVGIVHAPRGDFITCFLTDDQADPPTAAADIGACARAAYDVWEQR